MTKKYDKYDLLEEKTLWSYNNNTSWIKIFILILLCSLTTTATFFYWRNFYKFSLQIPAKLTETPTSYYNRAVIYAEYLNNPLVFYQNHNNNNNNERKGNFTNEKINYNNNNNIGNNYSSIKRIDDATESELIFESKLGQFFYKTKNDDKTKKLICYYDVPRLSKLKGEFNYLDVEKIDANLCTHLHIGMIGVINSTIHVDQDMNKSLILAVRKLKKINNNLKILIWVGGPPDGPHSKGFADMVVNHAKRKLFIQSLKYILNSYSLDGVDLDWEFPSAQFRERQHFSQLLHEIRREYERERRTYILSAAVAAPEGIAYFAYDIRELQNYCDYISIMTYDFHFYTPSTPFTGINAPLYARKNENSILATLNINYTISYWNLHGLEKNKIIIGLPTYGHNFHLVNAFNTKIGSPANGFGSIGHLGFASHSEICWFKRNNYFVSEVFDEESCSPYTFSGLEWISHENEKSLECKTKFILDNDFGGAMIFSLNDDDFSFNCLETVNNKTRAAKPFPLIRKVHSILFDKNV